MTTPRPATSDACRRIYYYVSFAKHDLKEIRNFVQPLEIIINALKLGECDTTPDETKRLTHGIHMRIESARKELDNIDRATRELVATLHELEESNEQ